MKLILAMRRSGQFFWRRPSTLNPIFSDSSVEMFVNLNSVIETRELNLLMILNLAKTKPILYFVCCVGSLETNVHVTKWAQY